MAVEYISREAVLAMKKPFPTSKDSVTLYQQYFISPSEVEKIPAADVVPVVRCGECEHYKKRYWENGRCYGTFCDIWNRDHGKTFFCESGIKREKKDE